MKKNCPTQNEFSLFLSGEMLEEKRETVELHLANCADCRRDLALMFSENAEIFNAPESLKEKVKNLPVKTTKANSASLFSFEWLKINRLQVGFASVLIVCFGVVGIYFLQNQTPANSDDVLRNGSSENDSIRLFAPEDAATLADEKITFRWSELPNVRTYTLIISDEKGDIIKEVSSAKPQIETSLAELGLTKEKHYFWHVKAKFIDGLTAESESRKVLVSQK